MGARSLILFAAALTGCCPPPAAAPQAPASPPAPPAPVARNLAEQVVADFEAAVETSRDAYLALFDFAAVGEMEILLHRYDLLGRLPRLDDAQKAELAAEDGTPYPAERERTNVGKLYGPLAQRTVGTGSCEAAAPRTRYGKLLGQPFEPLPANTPPGYETLRTHANAWLARGGAVRVRCAGGKGGLVVVYTEADNARGYDLLTIYDD